MSLATDAAKLRSKIKSGQLVFTVAEWQTVLDALDMVSGETEETRQADLSVLIERVKR